MAAPSANLNVMIRAARAAARGLVRDFGEVEQLQASVGGADDFVSRAERKAERLIRDALREARPHYGWTNAEGGVEDGGDPTRRWIAAPLDGVVNFAHGVPHWAVSVALEHKGKIVSAAIYDPTRDEMFTGETGAGAWLNDRRLRVSARRDAAAMLFADGDPPEETRDLAPLDPARCAGVRRFGAAALDLAWVAAGRCDGVRRRGASPRTIAAGMLLVQEAGGLVGAIGRLPGMGEALDSGDVIAANANAYDALNDFAAEARPGARSAAASKTRIRRVDA